MGALFSDAWAWIVAALAGALALLWIAAFWREIWRAMRWAVFGVVSALGAVLSGVVLYPWSHLRGEEAPQRLTRLTQRARESIQRRRGEFSEIAREELSRRAWSVYTYFAIAGAVAIVAMLLTTATDQMTRDQILANRILYATLLGALGLPLLFHKARINERQTKTAEDGHVTERIIKATELLGATKEKIERDGDQELRTVEPNVEVRIGAIYTLERVARESLDDHVTIMETLAAYIRENYAPKERKVEAAPDSVAPKDETAKAGENKEADEPDYIVTRPREDVLAALRVILRRSAKQVAREEKEKKPFRWQDVRLSFADLRELFTTDGPDSRSWSMPFAELVGANLEGASLWGANLQGANLDHAKLQGADLWGANLDGVNLGAADLRSAELEGADLEGAYLARANLGCAKLEGADLEGAYLARANLGCAKLEGADLGGANLGGANLEGANLKGANLEEAELGGANLGSAYLERAALWCACLVGANLEEAKLQDANLSGADLEVARLARANLWFANLEDANLEEADLRGANLGLAYLEGAYLEAADLRGAKLAGANFVGVAELGFIQFASVANNGGRSEPDEAGSLSEEQKAKILAVLSTVFADARLAALLEEAGIEPPNHWSKEKLTDPIDAQTAWRAWRKERGYD